MYKMMKTVWDMKGSRGSKQISSKESGIWRVEEGVSRYV
jgi:hypothetical protein